MIYSRWQPDRGGYAYYESSERRGLGDDLPTPRLRNTTDIGVASTDIGREMPIGSKLIGHGPLARGSVLPMDRSGLSGLSMAGMSPITSALLLAAGAVIGWFATRKLA